MYINEIDLAGFDVVAGISDVAGIVRRMSRESLERAVKNGIHALPKVDKLDRVLSNASREDLETALVKIIRVIEMGLDCNICRYASKCDGDTFSDCAKNILDGILVCNSAETSSSKKELRAESAPLFALRVMSHSGGRITHSFHVALREFDRNAELDVGIASLSILDSVISTTWRSMQIQSILA